MPEHESALDIALANAARQAGSPAAFARGEPEVGPVSQRLLRSVEELAKFMGLALPGRGGLVLSGGRDFIPSDYLGSLASGRIPPSLLKAGKKVDFEIEPLFIETSPQKRWKKDVRLPRDTIHIEVRPGGEPIRIGSFEMSKNPKTGSAYLTGLEKNPKVLMSQKEFSSIEKRVLEFLKAMGTETLEFMPATRSRERLFKGPAESVFPGRSVLRGFLE